MKVSPLSPLEHKVTPAHEAMLDIPRTSRFDISDRYLPRLSGLRVMIMSILIHSIQERRVGNKEGTWGTECLMIR